jgi:hypothetical protein
MLNCYEHAQQHRKSTLLPGKPLLKRGVHFQMSRWHSMHLLNFEYENAIKLKNKWLAAISRTLNLSTDTISRPPQYRKAVLLILMNPKLFVFFWISIRSEVIGQRSWTFLTLCITVRKNF